jgi:hypothetical protein
MFVSCGAQLPSDPPLGETEDISFRVIHRDTPLSKLILSHKTKVRKWAVEDLNVAFPLGRMKELEAEGMIGRLAPPSVSMVDPTICRTCRPEHSGDQTGLRLARRGSGIRVPVLPGVPSGKGNSNLRNV